MAEQKDRCIPQLRFPEFKNDGEWICKSLADVSDCYQGYGFPERLQGKTKGKYPFIKVSDISSSVNKGERYIDTAANYIDEVDVEEIRATPLPPGTIVFAKIGEAIKLNRRAILKQMSLIDNNVAGLKARPTIASDAFLYYILSRIDFSNYAGGVVPAIKKSTIEEIRVAFPPSLTEQQAIASCLTSLDSYISASKAKLEQLKAHKKGLMQKLFPAPGKTIPECRFPEFKNGREWVTAKLSDFIKMVSPPKKIQSSEYYSSGRYPIIDQSKDYICGFSNDENAVFNNDSEDVIVFGDHTCVLKLVDFPFIQGADGIKVFKSNNPTIVSTLFLYHFLSLFPVASVQYKRHFIELKEKEINFPVDIFEQSCITTCLSSLDSLITASQESLTQLIAHKQGLLKQLFL